MLVKTVINGIQYKLDSIVIVTYVNKKYIETIITSMTPVNNKVVQI